MKTDIHFRSYLAQFLECEMFQTKVVDEIKTHILGLITFFFFFENRAVYEIMWKSIVVCGRPQISIWRIACWIPKATNTHTGFVIFIAFFTATMVSRTRLSCYGTRTFPVFFLLRKDAISYNPFV
jgi:hypothetical protein